MRIVIFTQLYHPETATINDASAYLASRGHHVTVMTGLPNVPSGRIYSGYGVWRRRRENWRGVTVIRNLLVPRRGGSAFMMSINYLSFAASCTFGLWRLYRQQTDVILVNQLSPATVALPAIVYKWICRKPMAMWIHDLWPDSVIAAGAMGDGLVYRAIGRMVSFIYANCDRIFAQSSAMCLILERRGVKAPVVYIPNPIDPVFVPHHAAEPPEPLRGITSAFTVMFAGSIGAAQDVPTVLAAAALLQHTTNIQFVFVGDGRARGRAETLAEEMGLSEIVHFLGPHPTAEMPALYSSADIMLVTLRDEPIFAITVPLKIQTYMACGKPIVCNVRGEAAQVVTQANAGFTAPPEDPGALAAAILRAYNLGGDELAALGHNARSYFEANYSVDHVIDRLEKNLAELCAGARS